MLKKLFYFLFKLLFRTTLLIFKLSFQLFIILLPTLILIYFVETRYIELPNPHFVPKYNKREVVHEIMPNTRWSHLRPCGTLFNEQEEFKKALSCVNTKVWMKKPLDPSKLTIPRCFIVSTDSPDIFSLDSANVIPIITPLGIGAVVGVYQSETKTVFVTENVDSASIYRHEVQHFFLHLHDPITGGGGHYQEIWKKCEPATYEPSIKSQLIRSLLDNDSPIVVQSQTLENKK